jgi:L-Ala-D/L-Glu epimerase / N-acetyl-D-glutamate racemase
MKIQRLKAYLIKWPFTLAVSHSLANNTATANILIEVEDREGLKGYGEGVPRSYVTGEEVPQSLDALEQQLAPLAVGREIQPAQALGFVESAAPPGLVDRFPAASCALEIALLDLAGKQAQKPLSALLSGSPPQPVTYSAVVPLLEPQHLAMVLDQVQVMGLNQIKIKVSNHGAVERVAQVRDALGPEVRLRVDANGSWQASEAVAIIEAMEPFGVESVEQPVPKEDLEGLAMINRRVRPLVMADESMCTAAQARELIDRRAVGAFNLRLSKCGGPARTKRLFNMAQQAGLACQLGCQVGELGLLSAAGRHFASLLPELIHLEGSLTRFFLPRDVIRQDLTFQAGGQAPCLTGAGLGVEVDEAALADSLMFSLN